MSDVVSQTGRFGPRRFRARLESTAKRLPITTEKDRSPPTSIPKNSKFCADVVVPLSMEIASGLIRNQQVVGSNPTGGSREANKINIYNDGRSDRSAIAVLCHHCLTNRISLSRRDPLPLLRAARASGLTALRHYSDGRTPPGSSNANYDPVKRPKP